MSQPNQFALLKQRRFGPFFGVQLHPRDCRATMLEFDRSVGNERLDGAYWPAGPHWRDQQNLARVSGIR